MEMFHTSLKPILLHSNSSSKHKEVNDFELSVSMESIIAKLKGNEPSRILVHGESGCGLTTLLLGICNTLVENSWLEKSDVLSFRVRSGCSVQSLWIFLSDIAKTKHDKDTASLLLQSSTKLSKKNEAAQKFIASHFKLICVDDAFADGGVVWSHLSKLFRDINVSVIAVSSQVKAPVLQTTLTEQSIICVKLKGVGKEPYKKLLLQEPLPNWNFDDDKLSRIHSVLNGNPSLLKIFLNAVKEFNLPQENVDFGFLASFVNCHDEQEKRSVFFVIKFLFPQLTFEEKKVFYELCSLREPLPIVNVPEVVEKLVRLGLVRKEVIVKDTGTNNGPHALSVSSYFCISSLQRSYIADKDGQSPDQIDKSFSVFNLWFALLSEKLCQLIMDAQGNAWPFVPEKWQYISNVGEEEKYNIKELITAKNSVVPYLTEQDILEECLYHAVMEKIYNTVAALVFVMDRFSYWQGSSNRTLDLVDYLKSNSPDTPIAPQLLIRKARVMKNAGKLHGAEHVLDELLIEKNQVGEWVYKEKHDHQLVSAVCIQIKGDIQFNLGQWSQGAKLLIESLILFSTLPIPDTKGISSSLSILANCLEQMSILDYVPLAQSYGLAGSHPLLQAYACSYEAAIRSQYTPLFYARHKCRAAEFMLFYAQLIPDAVQQKEFLKIAAKDFKDSIQAHKELKSLSSREEFYVFVCAVYKLGLTYQFTGTQDSIQKAGYINEMSSLLYEHYCSFTGTILLDKEITDLISRCLRYLQLKQFCDEEDHHTRKTLISTSGNLNKSDTKGEGSTKTPYSSPLETSDLPGMQTSEAFNLPDYEYILKVRLGGYPVSDKLKETSQKTEWQDFAPEVLNRILVRLDKNSTDADALTVDRNSDTKNCVSGSVSGTVNRSIATQDLKQDTASLPNERFLTPEVATIQSQFRGLNVGSSPQRVQGAIVWRFDFTCREWRGQQTLAFVGDLLDLAKGKEGNQRDALMVEFLNQEDPFAKYVAKRYRKAVSSHQYQQDIMCQMTARSYAMLFNQQLTETDAQVGHIEFLPVALLQLVNSDGYLGEVYNVERYMAGEFVKFTNNEKFVLDRDTLVLDLVLAFSHFTYQASNNELIIVDIQGWTPASNEIGCTFLTDPQIHSDVYRCYGTGNLGQKGINTFWKEMHPECNKLCRKMHLTRPPQQMDKP